MYDMTNNENVPRPGDPESISSIPTWDMQTGTKSLFYMPLIEEEIQI